MSKHTVVPFTFESHSIRAINISGEPWFVAEDICNTLSLSNPTMSLKSLDDEERSKFNLGRQGEVNIVSESGMYTLVLRCRDAIKKGSIPHRFRKWVTADVLPSIRKTGSYTKPKTRQCTAKQLIPLRQTAERLITTGLGKIYPDIWKLVHQRFDVEHIHQLQPEQVGEAIEYLNVLEGEYLGKQSHLPAISFKNDYSMEFFKGYLWMIGEKSIRAPWCYPADLLSGNGDYPNPCGRLLSELKQQGYNVEAAQFQLLALQHHLEIHRNRMEAIQREIGGLGYR
ncbi:BRO-N domain-containing protein [Citrobacter freundii]|nr:Bro-N domain-containing protein [Citrobacter freundii]